MTTAIVTGSDALLRDIHSTNIERWEREHG